MKAKATHTPGPWEIQSTNDGLIGDENVYRIRGSDGYIALIKRIAVPQSENRGEPSVVRELREVKANAALIAAAPELLALLKKVACYCPVKEQDEIRAAIAKAEGGAS